MNTHMKIDFVSDISCPWCVIGLRAIEEALARIGPAIELEFSFQPFELNPQMPAEGQDLNEHIAQKYGLSPADAARNREVIRLRGAELGFEFRLDQRARIYNTFDAHRLLAWALESGRQLELKRALFEAYFTRGEDPGSHDVLLAVVAAVGLDVERARGILAGDEYAREVRERERFYHERGVHAVPSVIVNDRHLLQGGQPVEVFEQALREIAAGS